MMNSHKILFVLVVFISSILVSCAGEAKKVYVSQTKLDFGNVFLGESKELEFELRNKSNTPVSITRLSIVGSSNYDYTIAETLPFTLYPDLYMTLKVQFTPDVITLDSAVFKVYNNFTKNPVEVELTGSGKEVPRIGVSTASLEFKEVVINQTETHDVEIENIGTSILQISALNFIGADAALFTVSAGGTTPIDINPTTKHTIEITFLPVSDGNFTANLEIEHDAVNETSPQIIKLSGESFDIDPQITLNYASPIDFGIVSTILPVHKTIEIESSGTDLLKIRSISLANSTGFKINSIIDNLGNVRNYPTYMLVGDMLFIEIEFAPTANIKYDDKLTIDHNGNNAIRPLVIDFTGDGHPFITQTFQFTGAVQQFTVPARIHLLKIELWGGSGGDTHPNFVNTVPGKGGYVSGLIYVTPGQTYDLYVGGKGADGVYGSGGAGGWNGGGCGGTFNGTQQYGGAGGGATDIRFGGNTLYDRIIVAGAGGGAAAHMARCHGGAGGGLQAGSGMLDGVYQKQYCGGGGTQIYGGSSGVLWGIVENGKFGVGGNSFDIMGVYEVCGGGGAGGYWGGGAGNVGGGGGGSSYTNTQKIFNVQHQQGIHIGNGKIKLTY